MPINVEKTGGPGASIPDRRIEAARLMAELSQPLTAASNYAGTALAMLGSGESSKVEAAISKLEKAIDQILRAGRILTQLRSHFNDGAAELADERP